ncbi:hypothetical protein J3R83DRAFT_2597 [Lanmaoa asiatica]|nr:hypothetical protein J3R83DRAFT_2597 [Lanmaoa asiatica]
MFPDPLRTPRKHKHRASPTPDGDPDPDEQGTDVPSTPSPVKVSVGAGTHPLRRPATARSSHTPVLKLTRAQTRTAGAGKPSAQASRAKHLKSSHQHIPTPSSTRPNSSPRQSTAPSTPVQPRRSTRQAAVGARAKLKGTTTTSGGEDGGSRMKLRSRSTKANAETKTTKPTGRAKHPPLKSKATQKTTTTTTAKPARGRPKGKPSVKGAKGKGKARPLESVLDLSDDTRERYDKERRDRLEYFKRLEGYQIQKENVYVV